MKVSHVFSPSAQARRSEGSYVSFELRVPVLGSLPKDLPPVPKDHTDVWEILIGAKQWRRTALLLAEYGAEDDRIVVEGVPLLRQGTLVLLVSGVKVLAEEKARAASQKLQAVS